MSGVFRNIDLPPPQRPASVCGGRTHSLGGEGGGSIVRETQGTAPLFICKYFVTNSAWSNICKSKNNTVPNFGMSKEEGFTVYYIEKIQGLNFLFMSVCIFKPVFDNIANASQ
jgi:hypothetical protein